MDQKTMEEIRAEVEDLRKGIAQLQKDTEELKQMTAQYVALKKGRTKSSSPRDLYSLRLMRLIEKNGKHR